MQNYANVIFIYSIFHNFSHITLICHAFLCRFFAFSRRTFALGKFRLPFQKSRLFIFYAFFNFYICDSCTILGAVFLHLDILHKFHDILVLHLWKAVFFAILFPVFCIAPIYSLLFFLALVAALACFLRLSAAFSHSPLAY